MNVSVDTEPLEDEGGDVTQERSQWKHAAECERELSLRELNASLARTQMPSPPPHTYAVHLGLAWEYCPMLSFKSAHLQSCHEYHT